LTLSDVSSSKTRNQIITGTSIAVLAILTVDVYSSFKLSEASLANQRNTTNATAATDIPVANTPFYSEHITVTGQNPINASQVQVSLSGKGNLTLPNNTGAIAVNSIGSALVNFKTTSVIGHEFLTATGEGGSENASATIYEITRHDVKTRTEKGVVTAVFETSSTGQLAFLDGMIAVGQADVDAAGNTTISLSEFQTGIPYEKNWMELLMSPQE
jgi:hypothetical protein